jgi:RNA-directed DNA polymerase
VRLSEAKTRVASMSEGFAFLGFRIQWKRKKGTRKHYVDTFIDQRPIRALKAKMCALTPRTSQEDLREVLSRLSQAMHGWANYFRHAVAKSTFSMLDNFAWWRVIRMLTARHRWKWDDVRRQSTTSAGRWLPISAGDVELWRIAGYRANPVPLPRQRDPSPLGTR